MISFKQLESGSPRDIEVTTDDADAEMADFEDALKEGEFAESRTWEVFHATTQRTGDSFVFVIPGDEAGEIADFYDPLAEFISEVQQKAIKEAQSESD